MWRLHHGNTAEVIDAAVDCLLADVGAMAVMARRFEAGEMSAF